MKAILSALLVAGLFSSGASASNIQLSGCVMKDLYVKSVNLLLIKKGSGEATLTCNGDGPGAAMTKTVSIDVAGVGLGLGTFEFHGAEVQLGINNPYDLEGQYFVVNADAAVAVGGGLNLGLRGYEEGGLSFKLGIQGGQGIGAGIAATTWTFSIVD
ncbi:MAG: hypothetical protein AAF202_06655 [Pseudomonadota bacterium]